MEAGAGYWAVEAFAGWELRDRLGRRIGRVRRVTLDGAGRAAHVEVALGLFGTRTVLLAVGASRRTGRGVS